MAIKTKMISISENTYHNLAQMGTLEDTFDSVISKMIENEREKIATSGRTLEGSSQIAATGPLKPTMAGDNG